MSEIFKNLHLQLSTEDINKIDEWKARHGMKSRSEAIRSILRVAMSNKTNTASNFLNDRSESDFLTPELADNDFKDIIRDLVKEEVSKLKD